MSAIKAADKMDKKGSKSCPILPAFLITPIARLTINLLENLPVLLTEL